MQTCQDKVTVLEPERIREKLYQITSEIAKRYKENGNEKQSIGRDRPSE